MAYCSRTLFGIAARQRRRLKTALQIFWRIAASPYIVPMSSQEHLLIVDDDAEIRNLLRQYFQANGYRVTLAADGKGMWALLKTTQPDLVILDVMLPGEDGFSLCRTLRARLDVPIITRTARSADIDRIVGLEVCADDYLPKPFNPRELPARVKSVLRRRRRCPRIAPR